MNTNSPSGKDGFGIDSERTANQQVSSTESISRNADGELAYRTGGEWHTIPEDPRLHAVDDADSEIERKAAIYDLLRARHELQFSISQACQHRIQRQILSTVVQWEGIVMYERLYDCVNTGEGHIRTHVGKLADAGILRREGNPAHISIVDTGVKFLVEDQLETIRSYGGDN